MTGRIAALLSDGNGMNLLNLETSELTLHRYPSTNDPNLQAWDAADEYLLSELTAEQLQYNVTR